MKMTIFKICAHPAKLSLRQGTLLGNFWQQSMTAQGMASGMCHDGAK